MKKLKLILKRQPVGREETPWLEPYRERLGNFAEECARHFKDSKLKGAAKVKAMNRWMSERLRGR